MASIQDSTLIFSLFSRKVCHFLISLQKRAPTSLRVRIKLKAPGYFDGDKKSPKECQQVFYSLPHRTVTTRVNIRL